MIIICTNYEKLFAEKKRMKVLIYSAIFGLLLGAFFIFPLLEQYKFSDLVINNLDKNSAIGNGAIPIERTILGLSYFKEGAFYPPGVGLLFIIISLFRYKLKTTKKELITISDSCMVLGFVILIIITQFYNFFNIQYNYLHLSVYKITLSFCAIWPKFLKQIEKERIILYHIVDYTEGSKSNE